VQTAETLQAAYLPMFADVIFTGQPTPEDLPTGMVWVPCENTLGGQLMQKCFAHAMEVTPRPEWHAGYLILGDDSLFDPCAIDKFDSNKIWFWHDLKTLDADGTDVMSLAGWHWDDRLAGEKTSKQTLYDALSSLHGAAQQTARKYRLPGVDTYQSGVFEGKVSTDVLYIPQRFTAQYIGLAYHFINNPTHHEIAIPHILRLLTANPDDVITFNPYYTWDQNQRQDMEANPQTYLVPEGIINGAEFLHPWKLSRPAMHDHFVSWWHDRKC
jgi:hypothetical protein